MVEVKKERCEETIKVYRNQSRLFKLGPEDKWHNYESWLDGQL